MKPEEFKRLNIKALSKLAHDKPEVIADIYAFGYNNGWRDGSEQRDRGYNQMLKSKVTITN